MALGELVRVHWSGSHEGLTSRSLRDIRVAWACSGSGQMSSSPRPVFLSGAVFLAAFGRTPSTAERNNPGGLFVGVAPRTNSWVSSSVGGSRAAFNRWRPDVDLEPAREWSSFPPAAAG